MMGSQSPGKKCGESLGAALGYGGDGCLLAGFV